MFSGIVEERATVHSAVSRNGGLQLLIQSDLDHSATKAGDSICIDGVCLTATSFREKLLSFDLSPETIRKSTLGGLKTGQRVNLERALMLGERVGGHMVTGHIDGAAKLLNRTPEGDSLKLSFEMHPEFRRYLAPKGSVALAGVSLTVGEVEQSQFCVYIIPHTQQMTTLAEIALGQAVNIELDILARYVVTALSTPHTCDWKSLLEEHGYLTPSRE